MEAPTDAMCSIAEMNKLAPKLTIVFQLTVWSIVGIVLLQKGARSLYEKTLNPQGNASKWRNKGELLTKLNAAESRSQIIEFQGRTRQEDTAVGTTHGGAARKPLPIELHASHRTIDTSAEILETTTSTSTSTSTSTMNARPHRTLRLHETKKNRTAGNTDREGHALIDFSTTVRSYDRRSVTLPYSRTSVSFEQENSTTTAYLASNQEEFPSDDKDEILHKTTERSRSQNTSGQSPVNIIGAAVAIIMLAIGIVMLLLGPLIVIVRAIASRRRTREMLLKSRERNDQPPSYEEATLMDQAPRYSTLQLDTILDSPSSAFL